MRILLQFPEGLKQHALTYAQEYERKGDEVIISAEPSYGACDIPIYEAKLLKCDKIVHFGHTKYMDIREIPVEYVIIKADVDVKGVMKEVLKKIAEKGYKKVGVITNASHLHQVSDIKEILREGGVEPFTAKGSIRCDNEAQILGCDVSALNKIRGKVECILYFGAGYFHALAPGAVEDYTLPPVLWVDPYSKEVKWIDEELRRIQKKRKIALAKAYEAKTFGILVSTKIGQYGLESAHEIKRAIEKEGRKAVLICGGTFDFTSLNNFTDVQCFINTACPRLIDDQNKLRVPIINASDFWNLFAR